MYDKIEVYQIPMQHGKNVSPQVRSVFYFGRHSTLLLLSFRPFCLPARRAFSCGPCSAGSYELSA
jgi:hypothetical protein